jgi:hypothetical protein
MAADEMRLAATGEPEGEHVLAALEEAALAERGHDLGHLGGQPALEGRQGLLARQRGVLEVAVDAPPSTLLDLKLREVVQVLLERPALALGLGADLGREPADRRQLERTQQDRQALTHRRWRGHRRAHDAAPSKRS